MKLSPGAFGKIGATFEYSKRDERFKAIEVGVVTDAYLTGVEIMATQPTAHIFVGMFLSYRWGRVLQAKSLKG